VRGSPCFLLLAVAGLTRLGTSAAPEAATATACTLPSTKPVWIGLRRRLVPFWDSSRSRDRRRGVELHYPAQIRARGRRPLYFDLNFTGVRARRTEPAAPAYCGRRANRLYTYASNALACSRPVIAENELQGASTLTPWSVGNAQYRRERAELPPHAGRARSETRLARPPAFPNRR